MRRRKKGKSVAISLPIQIVDDILDLIADGYYSDIGDFIKEAVREHLRRIPWSQEESEG